MCMNMCVRERALEFVCVFGNRIGTSIIACGYYIIHFFRNGFRSVDFHREISQRRYNNNVIILRYTGTYIITYCTCRPFVLIIFYFYATTRNRYLYINSLGRRRENKIILCLLLGFSVSYLFHLHSYYLYYIYVVVIMYGHRTPTGILHFCAVATTTATRSISSDNNVSDRRKL